MWIPDPDLDRGGVRPGVAGERPLRFHRAQHGLVRASKRVEEGVALGVDLVAAVGGEGLPQEPLVLGQNLRPAPTQLPDELRRALDVGEQEGDGARRKLAHALIIRQRDSGFKLRRAPRFPACCPLRCPMSCNVPATRSENRSEQGLLMGREGFEPSTLGLREPRAISLCLGSSGFLRKSRISHARGSRFISAPRWHFTGTAALAAARRRLSRRQLSWPRDS